MRPRPPRPRPPRPRPLSTEETRSSSSRTRWYAARASGVGERKPASARLASASSRATAALVDPMSGAPAIAREASEFIEGDGELCEGEALVPETDPGFAPSWSLPLPDGGAYARAPPRSGSLAPLRSGRRTRLAVRQEVAEHRLVGVAAVREQGTHIVALLGGQASCEASLAIGGIYTKEVHIDAESGIARPGQATTRKPSPRDPRGGLRPRKQNREASAWTLRIASSSNGAWAIRRLAFTKGLSRWHLHVP